MTVRLVRRRLAAVLAAVALGATGALTAVTPAHAAGTCTVALRATWWPTADGSARWVVEGTLTNTGTATSTSWSAYLPFPSVATVPQWWNVTKVSTTSTAFWRAADYVAAVPANRTTNFGFEVRTPSYDTSPVPALTRCYIYY